MVCVESLARQYPNAPEALHNFWKAPLGSYIRCLVNSQGVLRYKFTKRDFNRVGESSIQRLNDYNTYTMRDFVNVIMSDRAYWESVQFFMPGEEEVTA